MTTIDKNTVRNLQSTKKEDTMKKELSNLIPISYYAFQRDPFDPDAEGYVEQNELIDWELRPWFIKWEGDQPVGRKNYKMVCVDDYGRRQWYVVKSSAIYSAVIPHNGLSGGYGLCYPGGGLSSTSGYDIEATIDGESVLLQRSYW